MHDDSVTTSETHHGFYVTEQCNCVPLMEFKITFYWIKYVTGKINKINISSVCFHTWQEVSQSLKIMHVYENICLILYTSALRCLDTKRQKILNYAIVNTPTLSHNQFIWKCTSMSGCQPCICELWIGYTNKELVHLLDVSTLTFSER